MAFGGGARDDTTLRSRPPHRPWWANSGNNTVRAGRRPEDQRKICGRFAEDQRKMAPGIRLAGRLENDRSLPTAPGDDRGPLFVVMIPPGLACLPASPRSAVQRLLPPLSRLALVARRMVEVIRFDGPVPLACHLIRQGGMRSHQPQRSLIQMWPPNSLAMRREEHARHNRKMANIQWARERVLRSSRGWVRSWKVRSQVRQQ
jgi:hypothetical protein